MKRVIFSIAGCTFLLVVAWLLHHEPEVEDLRAPELAPRSAPMVGTLSASGSSLDGGRGSEPSDSSRSPAIPRHADRDSILVTAVLPSPSHEPLDAGIRILALDAANDSELASVDSELGVLTRLRIPPRRASAHRRPTLDLEPGVDTARSKSDRSIGRDSDDRHGLDHLDRDGTLRIS